MWATQPQTKISKDLLSLTGQGLINTAVMTKLDEQGQPLLIHTKCSMRFAQTEPFTPILVMTLFSCLGPIFHSDLLKVFSVVPKSRPQAEQKRA